MQIGPFTLARTKSLTIGQGLSPLSGRGGQWWPWVRESFSGAWQQNVTIEVSNVLTYASVFACVTLIASDIAKLGLDLVEEDRDGIWAEVVAPRGQAWAPVVKKFNHYQNRIKFIEQWITSKLIFGNTYALKQRDQRRIVSALYVLDPQRVTPLVTPSGDVYYQLRRDDLSELPSDGLIVPASEIIHDRMICIYHPLIGVSPIYACGLAAMQGLAIQGNSNTFFANGSQPGGVLTAPGIITDETAARLKAYWDTNFGGVNVGKVAVVGDGLKYEPMSQNAVDSQLIDQLKWTAENVCTTFHVPPYMIGVGNPPPYANIEPLQQQYYAQALQSLIENLELCLDEGLELPAPYGTQVDLDDLFRMDTVTRADAAAKAIGSGGMSPNEARHKYFDLGPVTGGDTPYLQVQNYSLAALNKRDSGDPFAPVTPALPPAPLPTQDLAASFKAALARKALQAGLHAA
jgi:HK97 family phage portal protein